MTPPPAATALYTLLADRQSIRRYTATPVPPATLDRLLTAATTAPSAHNRQPWRFSIITQPAHKAALATAMGDRLRADRTADSDDPAAIAADVARAYTRLTTAPVLILVALTLADMDHYPDDRRNHLEYLMAVQSTAMAGAHLLLAAAAEGLAACWLCAPLFAPEQAATALNLPSGWQPQGLITLGYPAVDPQPRPRKPLPEITHHP